MISRERIEEMVQELLGQAYEDMGMEIWREAEVWAEEVLADRWAEEKEEIEAEIRDRVHRFIQ